MLLWTTIILLCDVVVVYNNMWLWMWTALIFAVSRLLWTAIILQCNVAVDYNNFAVRC